MKKNNIKPFCIVREMNTMKFQRSQDLDVKLAFLIAAQKYLVDKWYKEYVIMPMKLCSGQQ